MAESDEPLFVAGPAAVTAAATGIAVTVAPATGSPPTELTTRPEAWAGTTTRVTVPTSSVRPAATVTGARVWGR